MNIEHKNNSTRTKEKRKLMCPKEANYIAKITTP
jgi:hypothetical protein